MASLLLDGVLTVLREALNDSTLKSRGNAGDAVLVRSADATSNTNWSTSSEKGVNHGHEEI
jgi:hypothetical protein